VNELLEIRRLTVELPTTQGWVRPVNEVSLQIGAGECLGLVGESGSGKTMLSLALMGLLPVGARVDGHAWLKGEATADNKENPKSSWPQSGRGRYKYAENPDRADRS
jgi:ABC-type glutathione transport system ATPase component